MTESISSALKNWIPYRLFEEAGDDYCRWLYLGAENFTDPFFDETIDKCRKLSNNSHLRRCISSVNLLPEWSLQLETVAPTAFIFHISRCGSTLLSQLLSLNPENIVLSEVPLFDELLRSGHNKNNMEAVLPLLRSAIHFYAVKRATMNKRLFIKMDSWQIHFYKQFRALYPQTPFIFLYRRPDEVIRSQQKKRGMQSVPGVLEPEIFGFDKNEIMQQGLDEYMAKVIESYFSAFIKILQADKLSLPVNYNEGAVSILKKIAAFSGISMTEMEIEKMEQRSKFHGKYPREAFIENMPQEAIPAYLEKAFALYHAVEKCRM